jgi:hypothetical protein
MCNPLYRKVFVLPKKKCGIGAQSPQHCSTIGKQLTACNCIHQIQQVLIKEKSFLC